MKYRKQLIKEQPQREQDYPIYTHLTDLVDQKLEEVEFHCKECYDRECLNCSVELLKFLPEEESTEQAGAQIKWQR